MTPKTLLIGLDGVQIKRFAELSTALKRLQYNEAYTGGIVGESSEASTWSGPGWMTVLTGTWADKHGITHDGDRLRANPACPTVMRRLSDHDSKLSITSVVTWPTIHTFLAGQLEGVRTWTFRENDANAERVARHSVEGIGAGFTFLQLSDPDLAARAHGFGEEYDSALLQTDAYLNALLDAVQAREAGHPDEDWLVLVTTDHGRDASGYGHGGHSVSEKTIFIACNKEPNLELTSNNPPAGLDTLYGYAAQTAIAPTILRHMGIKPASDAWDMDSIPLIGELGARKPRVDAAASTLRWISDDSATVEIRKDGALAASVPASRQVWTDPRLGGATVYSLKLRDTYCRIRHDYIQTVLDWSGSSLFFLFSQGIYSRFNTVENATDPGYPRQTDEYNWPGLAEYRHLLVASFSQNKQFAFFLMGDGRYMKYDKSADKVVDGYPARITDSTWPGLGAYATRIRTAVRWKNDKVHIFLDDNTFLRYDLLADRVEDNYPQPVNAYFWPGLAEHKDRIVAAVRDGEKNAAFFFLDNMTYVKYDMDTDSVSDFYPAKIDNTTWPGLSW
ncbi:MAG TPA: hypothetical protein VJS90_15160 [Pseudomonas sp.]|nr:hypothetical protein [Pseudomonas sp.]